MTSVGKNLGLSLAFLALFCTPALEGFARQTPPPNRGGFTTSMGMPTSVKFSAGLTAGVHRGETNEAATYLFGSLYRDLINPAIAAVGVKLEAYGGRRGTFESWNEGG